MKQAILLLVEGSVSPTSIDTFRINCVDEAKKQNLSAKGFAFNVEDPHEVTFYLGRLVRFASGVYKNGDLDPNNGDSPSEMSFKGALKQMLFGPEAKKFWKTVMQGDQKNVS